MTYIPATLRKLVFERAGGRCEYCGLPANAVYLAHEIDHIRAEKHGGKTIERNLCLSCYFCNYYKGSDLASIDPETDETELLFHPRLDRWSDHFVLDGAVIKPLTAKGRATARLLRFNDEERILEREILVKRGRYS
jgi:hypothetical protein